jgi:phospholipid-binding lipoprotein MlaA
MSRGCGVVWYVGVLASLALLPYTMPVCAGDFVSSHQDAVANSTSDESEGEFEDDFEERAAGFPDPLETVNRATLRLNQGLDWLLLDPITHLYGFTVPDPAKRAVIRFLSNLDSPAALTNDILQREWKDARTTAARFVMNTTAGLAGLFDPASALGIEGHDSDFGQTLALAGVHSGPFLMLPALGPTTLRDGLGNLVDVLFRPTTYILSPGAQIFYTTIHSGTSGLAIREANSKEIRILRDSSIDYYATLRNAYYQTRIAEIGKRREHHRPAAPEQSADAELVPKGACGPENPETSIPSGEPLDSFLDAASRQIGDLPVDGTDKGLEAIALKH